MLSHHQAKSIHVVSHRIGFDICKHHFIYHSKNGTQFIIIVSFFFDNAIFFISLFHFKMTAPNFYLSKIKQALGVVPYIYRWDVKESTFCSEFGNDEKKIYIFRFFHTSWNFQVGRALFFYRLLDGHVLECMYGFGFLAKAVYFTMKSNWACAKSHTVVLSLNYTRNEGIH